MPNFRAALEAPYDGGGDAVREVHALVADLQAPRPAVYYADLLLSAGVGWTALLGAASSPSRPLAALLLAIAVPALYRAGSFIHELTHLRRGAVPGFGLAWNALVGVPLLMPSFLYVGGVHSVHHAKGHYGTSRDPEYLPIAGWPAWKIALWVLHGALLPLAVVLRFLVLAPLSLLHPRLRKLVWERASSLSVNPAFARGAAPGGLRSSFAAQEAAAFAWAAALLVLVARGVIPLRYLAFGAAGASAVGVLNQLRTLVAHRWRHLGDEAMTFEAQFQDSVNVPGNALVTPLWAPVGLRFHALHHLLPGLPYHALGAAHRRAVASLAPAASYHRASEPSLGKALRALLRAAPARRGSPAALPRVR